MIELVIEQRRRDLGGFEVGRVLPHAGRRMVGPFIFFDHFGPMTFARGISRDVDVRPHPHIGLATVTYLFAGEIMHRDSVESEQAIIPGEMNWMIAGSGITHSERFERARAEGGPMHGLQSWVALPREHEETTPAFAHFDRDDLPAFEADGMRLRLLAGEAFGVKSGVHTLSPLFYIHWQLAAGASVILPAQYSERAIYIVSGEIETDGQRFRAGQMPVFSKSAPAEVRAVVPSVVMGLGGEPVGERFIEWNFVSSSQERIEQAKADWRAGRMRLPIHDTEERIPLP
ncbi:MAG TPA: pirin family protein [Steroidobacteraceae bacterium]|nr:pirin family protein [Steroidobacteraceae bacterium]